MMVPTLMFQTDNPLLLTTDGEFVVKNLVLITAGLVLLTHARRPTETAPRERAKAGETSGPVHRAALLCKVWAWGAVVTTKRRTPWLTTSGRRRTSSIPGSAHCGRIRPQARSRRQASARRLRTALKSFSSVLDLQSPAPQEIDQDLRWLGGLLSDLRDADVLRRNLEQRLAELPSEWVIGSVREEIATTLAEVRQAAAAELVSRRTRRGTDSRWTRSRAGESHRRWLVRRSSCSRPHPGRSSPSAAARPAADSRPQPWTRAGPTRHARP